MADGFLAVDKGWRITFANPAAERILEFSQDELLGRMLWEVPTAKVTPKMEAMFRLAAREHQAASFDIMLGGTGRMYQMRLVPCPDGCTLYLTDVTNTRRLEVEAEKTQRTAHERASRIARLNAELAKATTSQDVIDAVTRGILAPFGAMRLSVQVIEGDRLRRLGVPDSEGSQPRQAGAPEWDALESGRPHFFPSRADRVRHGYAPTLCQSTKEQAWAYLPLTSAGETFGICTVAFPTPRRLTDDEQALLNTTCSLFAQALDRARLYDAEHARSRTLQRSLLPRELPTLPSCTPAARYVPAGDGMDVGGDWYDVIPLSSGQVALVIGDVMGHGLAQVATMGRLRTAVHTLSDLELPPDEIITHLNDIVVEMGNDSYATCAYVVYDSASQSCSMAIAGHPPPALVHADGTVRFLPSPGDPPLGVAKMPFERVGFSSPGESVLVLYTDGLVESSTLDIDEGLSNLGDHLHEAFRTQEPASPERLCEILMSGLLPQKGRAVDDAALLVTQLHALPSENIASWPLDDSPTAAGEARSYVRGQLVEWGLNDLVPTTELLVSELVGNVVRHARGPMSLRLLLSDGLVCEVSDASPAMPRIRRSADTDEGGRGLQLITALTHRWGARYTQNGKCIWTEQLLDGGGGVTGAGW
ncbi:SpoIIE family protein phosphatase [Streptomyces parvulus]|uniref:SpoIIE family protein phosphatase n=1 Tax=Streptomyces parvulus TaxID=146923 RepID=UPI003807B83B